MIVARIPLLVKSVTIYIGSTGDDRKWMVHGCHIWKPIWLHTEQTPYAKFYSVIDRAPIHNIFQSSRNFNLHINSGFSQRVYVFWSNQFLLSSQSSRSKFHKTRARMTRISAKAKFLPIQFRGPTENGCRTSRLSVKKGDDGSLLASESHRSGRKRSGA